VVAPPVAVKPKQVKPRAVKLPASTPCMITPNNLRRYLGEDKEALRQANFVPYPDVEVGRCVGMPCVR
jgi:hypothetical protein